MRNFTLSVLTATLLIVGPNVASAAGKLSIYHWFEYIPQSLLDKFAQEHDVEVTMDTYDSNESLLSALKAGSMGQYDVAVPSDYMVKIMSDEGMLDEIKPGELNNASNIEAQWVDVDFDPGRKHSIPYQWGSTSFSVNTDFFKGDINTTALVFDPPQELQGKINVLDSQGELLAFASLHLGIPQCTNDRDQLKALDELMQNAKAHWASFNSDGAKDVLVSGDAMVGMIWNGYGAKARVEGAPIQYAFPKEGYLVWMDNVVLLADAPNRANALLFMDFLLKPENIAVVSNFAQYTAGVEGVTPLLTEALKVSPEQNPPADAPAGTFVVACDEETQALYDRLWTRVKQ